MSDDISKILERWPYVPGEVTARIVRGDDGRDRIQLRVDLGVLQMEMDGRPDGARPEKATSWFDYYQHLQETYDAAHLDSPAFELNQEACQRLWIECVQYYHRYLCFWHLNLYEQCARDTQRNLRVFDFVRRHVRDSRAHLQFDQWRPYALLMHARSVGTPLVAIHEYDPALRVIDAAIDGIQEFLELYNQEDHAEQCAELADLQQWRRTVVDARTEYHEARGDVTVDVLRRQLQEAIELEEFEEAARLRDEIRRHGQEENPS
ncbi:MAG TPA: UvrB/UvrC motif-containing protein [Thermoguttaceae bacterium]|nr:UvrB/UvrC motif-containing protein [Thermoguttaceae bacterium]